MPEIQEITKMYPDHGYGSGRGLGEGALATATGVAGGVVGYLVGRGMNVRNGCGCNGNNDCGGGCGGCGGSRQAAAIAGGSMLATMAEKDAEIARLKAGERTDTKIADTYGQTLRDNDRLRDEMFAFIRPVSEEAAKNRERVAVLEAQVQCEKEKAALREELLRKDIELARQEARCCCDKTNMRIDCLEQKVNATTKTVIPSDSVCPDPAAAAQDRRNDAFMALVVRALDKYLGGTAAATTLATP